MRWLPFRPPGRAIDNTGASFTAAISMAVLAGLLLVMPSFTTRLSVRVPPAGASDALL
jgi:hypothetical protein